jgi:N utilization substance protein B
MDADGTPSKITPHKNNRREAREMILRMLFQMDVGKQPMEEVIEASLAQSVLEGGHRQYAEEVARGAWSRRAEIDEILSKLTNDWTSERQAAVDRNILRLTAYEILHRPDTPVAAVINEAVELAKKYSTAESGRFVNGVLGSLARAVPRGSEQDESPKSPEENAPGEDRASHDAMTGEEPEA